MYMGSSKFRKCLRFWGPCLYNALDKLDTIQHRAIRIYLGVHKLAPNKAINADMGWQSSRTRRHVDMLRLWNRLLIMEPQRLTRKIFEWDKDFKRGWCKNVSEILSTIRCSEFFDANRKVDLTMATSLLHDVECEKWKVDVLNVPKLRTYVLFKNSYKTEPYLSVLRNRRHRSMMAQFRCGILPLRVETGRFMSIPPEYRLCLLCDTPNTEDETHFLFHCKFYTDNRKDLFSYAESKVGDFRTLDIQTKFQILMSTDIVKKRQNSYLTPWKNVEEHSMKPYNLSYDNLCKAMSYVFDMIYVYGCAYRCVNVHVYIYIWY